MIANIFFAVFIEGDFSKGRMRIISTLIMYSLLLGSALRIYHDVTAILCRSEAINEEMSKLKFELATSKNYTAEQTSNVADKIKKLHILCDCNESVCLLAETTNCMFSSQVNLYVRIQSPIAMNCLSLTNHVREKLNLPSSVAFSDVERAQVAGCRSPMTLHSPFKGSSLT